MGTEMSWLKILKDILCQAVLCCHFHHLPESEFFSENREESQIAEPLCTNGTTLGTPDATFAPGTCKSTCENFGKPAKSIVTNFTCKDTVATWISGFPVENVEL